MEHDALKQIIEKGLSGSDVIIRGDSYHFEAIIVSEQFIDCSSVKRQQLVYQALGDSFSSGALHAFSMKTYTPEEWQQEKNKVE